MAPPVILATGRRNQKQEAPSGERLGENPRDSERLVLTFWVRSPDRLRP